MRRRSAGALSASRRSPSRCTLPRSGVTSPSARRRSVDFPQPLAPISTVVVWGAKSKSTSRTAGVWPKLFETPRSDSTRLAPVEFEHQRGGQWRNNPMTLGLKHGGKRRINRLKQRGDVHPHKALAARQTLSLADRDQLSPGFAGQTDRASNTLDVVLEERGRELDQALQEQALRTFRPGPKTLPRFMRFPPEGLVEEIDPVDVAPLFPPAFARKKGLAGLCARASGVCSLPGVRSPAPWHVAACRERRTAVARRMGTKRAGLLLHRG